MVIKYFSWVRDIANTAEEIIELPANVNNIKELIDYLILSETELKKLPRPIRREPTVISKIMHFGPGAFFRSFVASLIDDVNRRDFKKWGIIAVSLNSVPEIPSIKIRGRKTATNIKVVAIIANEICLEPL